MTYIRALMRPSYALERIKHYGVGRVIIDQAKSYPATLPAVFKALRAAKISYDFDGYRKRRRIAAEIRKTSRYADFFPRTTGYAVAPPGTFSEIEAIIPEARRLYQSFIATYPDGLVDGSNYNNLLYDHSKSREHHKEVNLEANPQFQRLASSRALLEIACCYLGEAPILGSIILQVAMPNSETEGFQKFHIDGGGNAPRQLKIFIAVEDVDRGNGATMIMPSDESARIAKKLGYKTGRLADDVVMSEESKQLLFHAEGPAGTAFFFDTCRSIHAGARTRTRPRVLLMLQYISKYISGETALQRGRIKFDREMASRDELARLLFDVD